MKLPWTCSQCNTLNMVDMDRLQEKPIDKIKTEKGYTCEKCQRFQGLYIATTSLDGALEKLERLDRNRRDFYWHFGKTLKKAFGIQKSRVNG